MILISAFSTTLALIYFLIILRLHRALQAFNEPAQVRPGTAEVSVVIAFRNESHTLPDLLKNLERQDYPSHLWEAVLINDHSDDDGAALVSAFCNTSTAPIKLLQVPAGESGKKAAIRAGIEASSAEIIIQTDADCEQGPQWLSTMVRNMESARAAILLGPVQMDPANAFWSKFAALDFMALQAVGAGMAILQRPVMGSAANMAYRTSIYGKATTGDKRASGDDVFLIQQSSGKAVTAVTLARSALVKTGAPSNFRQLVEQRARWGGKATSYKVVEAQALSVLIATLSLCQVLLLLLAFFDIKALIAWGVVMLLKATADIFILKEFACKTGQEKLLRWFVPACLLYPFYILITGVVILMVPVRWKGRSLRPLSD